MVKEVELQALGQQYHDKQGSWVSQQEMWQLQQKGPVSKF